jgi:predicted phosphodiesterase
MTRIALLSDIHGNLPALERVIKDMRQFAPDHVVVAGDMVNWGPFSAEVMQVIYENRWTMIRGNNEYYCINATPPRRPDAWASYTMLAWLHEQLSNWHHVIASLPDDLLLLYPDTPDVHLCHGIPGDCWTGIYSADFDDDEMVNAWLSYGRAETIFCGHTHVPLDRTVGPYHILNPGSVGVPLLGEAVSSYMIVDGTMQGWELTHHRTLPLDISALRPVWKQQRFVERCGVTAQMVIEEFERSYLVLHSFNAWMRQEHSNETATFEHGASFLQIDPSPYMPKTYLQTKRHQYLR